MYIDVNIYMYLNLLKKLSNEIMQQWLTCKKENLI